MSEIVKFVEGDGAGGHRAEVLGSTARGRTPSAALLAAARAAWRDQGPLVPRGEDLLRALRRVRERLATLVAAPSVEGLRDVRVDARALGSRLSASASDLARAGGRVASDWLATLDRRVEAVASYVERTRSAGPIPSGGRPIGVVYADPPWPYRDEGTRANPAYEGAQRELARYATLPDAEIAALGESLLPLLAPDALLFLWVTNSVLVEGRHLAVCRAWGFEPRVLIPWIKWAADAAAPAMGMGHYTRSVSEEVCVAARGPVDLSFEGDRIVIGSRGRAASGLVRGRGERALVLSARRAHSEKPDEAYELVERLVTPRALDPRRGDEDRRRICSACEIRVEGDGRPHLESHRPALVELFARRSRPGWLPWGAEAPR